MKRVLVCLVLAAVGCGDSALSVVDEEPDAGANSTTNNVVANNVVANNVATNSTTPSTGCVVVDGSVLAADDAALEPYRGARCVRVRGDVILTDEVSDLADLGFEEIGGDLRISGTNITNGGMSLLLRVAGSLVIEDNSSLTVLDGFSRLDEVGGSVVVSNAPVEQIVAFSRLGAANALVLKDLPNLTSGSGFGRVRVDTLAMYEVDSLDSMEGISRPGSAASLQMYGNDLAEQAGTGERVRRLELVGNPQLSRLNVAFDDAEATELIVAQNDALGEFVAAGVTTVGRAWVLGNGSMATVSFPDAVSAVEEMRVENQPTDVVTAPALTDVENFVLDGLAVQLLTDLGLIRARQVVVRNNPELTSLAALSSLQRASSLLQISDNATLGTIQPLRGMTFIGTLRVQNNPMLPECEVLLVRASTGTVNNVVSDGNDPNAACF